MARRVNFMKTAAAGVRAKTGARHSRRAAEADIKARRRELEKLRSKHPAEYAEATRRLRERGIE